MLSIGGGSALDTAKLVAYFARSDERLDDIYGVGLAKGPRLPLLLVPTTAGTGSEVTPIAIVTTPTTEKKGVLSPRLLPDWAILDRTDARFAAARTAATGIDAMVHAIEAYTSRHKKNPISDQFALQALALFQRTSARCARTAPIGGARACCSARCWPAWLSPTPRSRRACARLSDRRHLPRAARPLQRACAMGVLRFNLPEAEALYAELSPILDPDSRDCRPPRGPSASLMSSPRSAGTARFQLLGGGRREGSRSEAPGRGRHEADPAFGENPRESLPDAYAIYSEALDGKKRQAA